MSQLPFAFSSVPSYAPDDFLLSDANQDAHEWMRRTDAWPAYGLRLSGPRGSGRTHLAHLWASLRGASFITPPAPDAAGDLVVDNAAHADETSLFHLLNRVRESNRRILLVLEEGPVENLFRLPDLRSRLNALPQAALGEPDDALLAAVFRKQITDRQLRVPEEVIHYLLTRIERSFASVQKMVQALDEQALAARREITLPLARHVLSGMQY